MPVDDADRPYAGEHVRVEVDEDTRVGTIRIDRPKMNAFDRQVWGEIEQAARWCTTADAVGAVVVWGGPRVFAAGADIKDFPDWTMQSTMRDGTLLQRSLDTVARMPKVTIAAINGYALGGGCELTLACDFRWVADDATLGQPEVLLGLIPGAGGTQRLPRLVGLSRAKELIFSGRMVGAEEAVAIGMADRLLPPDEVYDAACEQAARYARGPFALRLAKRAIDEGASLPLDAGLRLERDLFAAAFGTDDAATGIASFIEHGPGAAEFTGN